MFTGRDARKGAVYDRTENERNAANKLVWMLESELYKGENPCRFLAREEIAYRYPIMYEMIRRMFSPDDTNPPESYFISCVTFGKSAEFAQKYLHKGMRIVIGGRISTAVIRTRTERRFIPQM